MRFIKPNLSNIKSINKYDVSWAYKNNNPVVRYFYFQRLIKSLSLVEEKLYKNALDMGTGSGILLPTLSRFSKNVVGIDVLDSIDDVENFIEKEGIKNVSLIKKDLKKMDFKPKSFDLICGISVFEHIEDLDSIFQNIKNILTDDGTLLLGYPIESFLTKIGFKYAGVEDDVEEQHISDYKRLREVIPKYFKIAKRLKYPSRFLPDTFTLYEAVLCTK